MIQQEMARVGDKSGDEMTPFIESYIEHSPCLLGKDNAEK
eukprot:CAMPEP_0116910458 /NCGR_PEP_ID=MMETSP0467-20121206/14888_1 /TAXON_ID=283647 /ORGANISM="Mesodinium pulex, Strain SPMC105" /LENGTH=39 /DNA_ID= /DNA_START= /DNA_END= /DNA_ORIENTATION=